MGSPGVAVPAHTHTQCSGRGNSLNPLPGALGRVFYLSLEVRVRAVLSLFNWGNSTVVDDGFLWGDSKRVFGDADLVR